MSASLPPRRAALRLLRAILEEGRLLHEAMAGGTLKGLEPADRARAQRLALDVLRGMERADRLLGEHLRKTPPPPILAVLRLGTTELAQGAAAHGVVNDMVTLAREDRRHERLAGLVNAVLRKVAPMAAEAWPRMRPSRLPAWLREPLVMAWGEPAVAAMEAVQAETPPLDLTARDDSAVLAEEVGGTLLPTGSVRVAAGAQVTDLPGYAEGRFWVQDAAAALPARLLDPQPGERVLDLCAAPGGKTLQLAAAGAQVTALDVSDGRLRRLRDNLSRTGLAAEVVVADALEFTEGGWDAILLDAPCSATGTLRRHPDLPFAKDGSEFGALIELQARLLDHALGLLRPGGRLVFCTCSLLPDEGEVQIEEALARHPGLRVDRQLPDGADPAWQSEEGGLRIRPDHWADRGGIDGFYMARLSLAET